MDKLKTRHRIVWRIYLYNILVIISVIVATAIVHFAWGQPNQWHSYLDRAVVLLGKSIVADDLKQPHLEKRLEEIFFVTKSPIAVYSFGGKRLAVAGSPIPAPLSTSKLKSLRERRFVHDHSSLATLIPIEDPASYVIVSWREPAGGIQFLSGLLVVLLVIGLLSLPLARTIAKPIEKLTDAARKLGKGDLSHRVNIKRNDELGALASTVDEMAERLERRIRSEKELLANVSHELRTPLSRIRVALELCSDNATRDEIERNLIGIAEDVVELDTLLEDVFTVTRLDLTAAELVSRKKNVRLAELIVRSKERFQSLNGERTLNIVVAGETPTIEADPALFRRMIDNLLDNAAKYSQADTEVELRVSKNSDTFKIEVSDRGIGISAEAKSRVFEPFYREETSRSQRAGGKGLGLTLVKRIAEAHGGNISVVPRDGGGTTFIIAFPLA